jgi:hypothetical protein
LPSYVFVGFLDADQAIDLGQIGKVPRNWAFLFNGSRPPLPIDQLSTLEIAATMRPDAPERLDVYRCGQCVSIVYGPMHGHSGAILGRKGHSRWIVEICGQRVIVPAFLLRPVGHISGAS